MGEASALGEPRPRYLDVDKPAVEAVVRRQPDERGSARVRALESGGACAGRSSFKDNRSDRLPLRGGEA